MPCCIILHRAVQCPGAFDREDGRYTRTCWNDQGHVGPTPTKTLLAHFTENVQGNMIEGKGQIYNDIAGLLYREWTGTCNIEEVRSINTLLGYFKESWPGIYDNEEVISINSLLDLYTEC